MRKRIVSFCLLFFLFLGAGIHGHASPELDNTVVLDRVNSRDERFLVRRVLKGAEHPWSIAFIGESEYLVTERPGRLWRITGAEVREVRGLPAIATIGQGGLLDIAVDPEFRRNRRIYLTYSSREAGGYGTRLLRGVLNGSRLEEVEVLFRMEEGGGGGRHFGSRVVVGEDGNLYMTIGDRGSRERAQDPGDHAGKTIRIDREGRVPRDNPFIRRMDALPEVYTLGNRNAQGMAIHPETGEIWQHEHGPRGGDEINIIDSGVNYGWPEVTYGRAYSGGVIAEEGSAPGYREPVLHWTPSIAPSGMTFYDGSAFPGWKGDLFVGALAGEHLRRVMLDGNRVIDQEELLSGDLGRIRAVTVGPEGYLYLLTDARSGGVYRLEPLE